MFKVINFWDDNVGNYSHQKLENFLNDYGLKKEDIVAINTYFNLETESVGINLIYEEKEEKNND